VRVTTNCYFINDVCKTDLKNFKEENYLGDFDTSGNIMLKCSSHQQDEKMWTGFIWLRKGKSGSLLLT